MGTTFEQYEPANPAHIYPAAQFSFWSRFSGSSMLPFTPEAMKAFPYSLLALDEASKVPLGHTALKYYENQQGMVGAFVVNPALRRRGIGTEILSHLLGVLPSLAPDMQSCQTYVNEASRKLFTGLGGVVVGRRAGPIKTNCTLVVDLMPALERSRL